MDLQVLHELGMWCQSQRKMSNNVLFLVVILNFYRSYIPWSPSLNKCLYELTHREATWDWSLEREEAFCNLRSWGFAHLFVVTHALPLTQIHVILKLSVFEDENPYPRIQCITHTLIYMQQCSSINNFPKERAILTFGQIILVKIK